jgi:hypothetical protein
MKFNFLFKTLFLGVLLSLIISCDKDFNQIGDGVIGDNNNLNLFSQEYSVKVEDKATGEVQTNNLPLNNLGFYNNDVFGTTKSEFVTQLALANPNPIFINSTLRNLADPIDPTRIIVDSVYLYVPYFSTKTATNETTGNATYTLDSIIGSGKIKLDVFRSNDTDLESGFGITDVPNSSNFPKTTFSNSQTLSSIAGTRLNDGVVSENDEFEFKSDEIRFYKNDPVTGLPPTNLSTATVRERLAPGMFLLLNKNKFHDDVINASKSNLLNSKAFQSYYSGLAFKVTPLLANLKGVLNRINFAAGKITIVYRDKETTVTTNTKVIKKTMVLNLIGNTRSVITNTSSSAYTSALNTISNPIYGDEKLYIKGGKGSLAIIDLFGGINKSSVSTTNDLALIKSEGRIINEANLIFTVDVPTIGAENTKILQPNRILLYDLDNKRPLVDFFTDFTTAIKPKFTKTTYGGIISAKTSNDQITTATYKFRITDHIRNLVIRDSTNVRLGLVVTENVSVNNVVNLSNNFLTPPTTITKPYLNSKYLPLMSVLNPLGTVLWGSFPKTSPNYAKGVKLEIKYIKPQ